MKILVACDENRVIGKDNSLIWYLPADLKRFKALTTGQVIIMGRKTYDSIGKPLPNRTNIVVTRQKNYAVQGVEVVHSLEEAILKAKSLRSDDIFVIGGAEIYQLAMSLADQIVLTKLHDIFDGDTYFPEISEKDWEIIDQIKGETDEKNPFQFSFITYQRRQS